MSHLSSTSRLPRVNEVVTACEVVSGEAIDVENTWQPRGRYGLCARRRDGRHVILVDPEMSGDLYLHTVLHELGHILLGHNTFPSPAGTDRLTALLTGTNGSSPSACVVPHFREWAQRENEAEQFASTVARRLRRGLTSRRLSRLDEAFG